MAIDNTNKTKQSLENRLIQRLARLEEQFLQLKTAQPVGADVVDIIPFIGGNSPIQVSLGTLTAGTTYIYTLSFIPSSKFLTIWEFQLSLSVDSIALATNAFPNGSALSSAQKHLRFSWWIDWYASQQVATSSAATPNSRVINVMIENTDTGSHSYFLNLQAFLPKQSI